MHGCGIELTIYFDIFALCRLSKKNIYSKKNCKKEANDSFDQVYLGGIFQIQDCRTVAIDWLFLCDDDLT